MLPSTMTAVPITRAGGPEVLEPVTRPVPQPQTGQVLIKVAYAGVNRHDCGQRIRGFGPKGATDIAGLEVAGEVAAVGAGVTRWKAGDRVCALVNGGGYAQYCIALQEVTFPIPERFDLKQAAATPETLLTSWFNVFMLGRLKEGEWLLVHGGSSGIGTMTIQLARLIGAKVAVTAGSGEKCAFCVKLGAASAINYRDQDFVAAMKEATAGHGADVILDMVGGDYIARNYEAAGVEGRIVQIAFQGSSRANVDFLRIMLKRLTHTGSTLRARAVADKAAIAKAIETNVWPLIAAGKVTPVIYRTFPLREAAAAHALMETSAHIGKIVLTV